MTVVDDPFAPPPFTGAALDRVSAERRDPDWVARQLRDPAARAVLAGSEGVLIEDRREPALARCSAGLRDGDATPSEPSPVLLGLEHGAPLFALDLDAAPATLDGIGREAGAVRTASLREAGALLPHADAGLAAYATALLNWHRRHRFCANCGAATRLAEGGAARHCDSCGSQHFPRTDPVVIMTVEHAGRLLLGRRSGWPSGRVSVLAGFVAPGESAEEAVVREVAEESGVVARDPAFVVSQPWPFPASLMLGFHAESDGGEPRASDGELEEVAWHDRARVAAAAAGATDLGFQLPPPISVARVLIERWLAAGANRC